MVFADKRRLGYIFIAIGVCLYSFSDAIMKYFMPFYGVHQITFLRTVFRFIPFLVIVLYKQVNPLKTSRIKENILRSILASVVTYTFMYAYNYSAMTDVLVVSLTAPIFVIPLSIWILKEKFHIQNAIAILFGFSGICLAFRPGCKIFQIGIMFAVIGAITSALNMVIIKRLVSTDSELTIIFYHHLLLIFVSFFICRKDFIPMQMDHLSLLLIGGFIGASAQYCIIHAFKLSTSSELASATYFMLIPNTILDFILYGRVPDIYIIGGLILILIGSLRAFTLQSAIK